jgi:hypothetical protein
MKRNTSSWSAKYAWTERRTPNYNADTPFAVNAHKVLPNAHFAESLLEAVLESIYDN